MCSKKAMISIIFQKNKNEVSKETLRIISIFETLIKDLQNVEIDADNTAIFIGPLKDYPIEITVSPDESITLKNEEGDIITETWAEVFEIQN